MNSIIKTPELWAEQIAIEQPEDVILARRCIQQTAIDKDTNCWNRGGMANNGYPYIKMKGKRPPVRKLVCQIRDKQPVSDDMFVRAHCNNPRCINPAHLYLKSQHDCGVDDLAPYLPTEIKPKPPLVNTKLQKITQRAISLRQRFLDQWEKDGEHEIWIGGRSHGVPTLRRGKRNAPPLDPIRMRYEMLVRRIKIDEDIIHLCEHKDCGAIVHLKVIKKSEKVRELTAIRFQQGKVRDSTTGHERFISKRNANALQLINTGGKRYISVHRYAYEDIHGQGSIPESYAVVRNCGCPECVNIDHLELKSKADIARENVQKRQHKGGNHATATV